jgi:hypothetical protein
MARHPETWTVGMSPSQRPRQPPSDWTWFESSPHPTSPAFGVHGVDETRSQCWRDFRFGSRRCFGGSADQRETEQVPPLFDSFEPASAFRRLRGSNATRGRVLKNQRGQNAKQIPFCRPRARSLPSRNANARRRITLCAARRSHFYRAKFIPEFVAIQRSIHSRIRQCRWICSNGNWKVT